MTVENATPTIEATKKPTKAEKAAKEFIAIEMIKMATFVMVTKPRTTFFVTNYEDFELIEGNRKLTPRPRLKEDIEKFGQLDPVAVIKMISGKWGVLNGQGRLHYLKELGYPVECIEIKEDYSGTNFDAIKSYNTKGADWIKDNYSVHYEKEGNNNFIIFKKLNSDFLDLTETIIYSYVHNWKAGRLKVMYENGTLDFNPTPEQINRLAILNDLFYVIKSQRKHFEIKGHFDRPQIAKLLDEFLTIYIDKPDFDIEILKRALRTEDEPLTRADDLGVLTRIYKRYLPKAEAPAEAKAPEETVEATEAK